MMKMANSVLRKIDKRNVNIRPLSYPSDIVISLSNNCNQSCPICSINNLKYQKIQHVSNNITLQQLKMMSSIFRFARSASFMGLINLQK